MEKIYLHKLKKYGSELIFECNLKKTDIDSMFKKGSFLSDILSSWNEVKNAKRDEPEYENAGEIIIWNNSNLRIANKTFFFQFWFDNGVKFLKDIYNSHTNQFYTFIELVDKYHLPATDFLKYMSLKSCIPVILKNKLDTNVNNNINISQCNIYQQMLKTKDTNKFLYKYQSKNNPVEYISSQNKWAAHFENENLQWEKIYSNIYTSTIDTTMRNFQYKYLFRITPTNKRLFTQKISNSNLCDFCNMDIETIQHLFWECNHVQIFWNSLHNFINNTYLQLDITFQTISFGLYVETDEDTLKNYILFYAKYYIFLNKCHKTIPSCELFKLYLYRKINVEKELALMNDKLYKFEQKWRHFLTFL